MLNMILTYLPVLGIAIAVNVVLGLYNNISNIKECFDWKKLLNGVIKAACISAAFIGLAYCFDATGTVIDVGVFDITPELIMTSAIILYVAKGLKNLASILGVNSRSKDEE